MVRQRKGKAKAPPSATSSAAKPPPPPRKHETITADACAPLVIGAAFLVLYWRTASPSVGGGDSGELLSEACVGGVAHPPGYGLYLAALAAAFRLFPDRTAAAAGALCSAAAGAVAAGAVAGAASAWAARMGPRVRAHRATAALVAGAGFGCAPLCWERGRKRVRNSQLQRLLSRPFSTRFG